MPLNEKQRRDFKTLPDGDYSEGIISEDGGMFKSLLKAINKRNKGMADSLSGGFDEDGKWKNDVSDETILDATDSVNPVGGMFVPVKKTAAGLLHRVATNQLDAKDANLKTVEGMFSDVDSKAIMKWIDDGDMRLRTTNEVADKIRKQNYPDYLEQRNFEHPSDWEDAVLDELSKLNRRRVELESTELAKHSDELAYINNRIAWVIDPQREMDWVRKADGRNVYTLDTVIDHPKLFKEMPELRDVKVTYDIDPKSDILGNSRAWENTIGLNPSSSRRETASTILHEVQHNIQDKSGWPVGGSSEQFERQYNRNKRRLSRLISGMQAKKMLGEEIDEKLYSRIVKAHDEMPKPSQQYKNLHGEQQSRAVQAKFENPTVHQELNKSEETQRAKIWKEWKKLDKRKEAERDFTDADANRMDELQTMYEDTRRHISKSPYSTLLYMEDSLPKPKLQYNWRQPKVSK